MIHAGLPAERIVRVVGKADKDPFVADNPFSPLNRRISILLLRDTKPTSTPGSATDAG